MSKRSFLGVVELKGYMSKYMVSKKYAQMKLMAWILIKVLGEARCGLLMLQADMSQSCGLLFSKSNDCTQLASSCAELIH